MIEFYRRSKDEFYRFSYSSFKDVQVSRFESNSDGLFVLAIGEASFQHSLDYRFQAFVNKNGVIGMAELLNSKFRVLIDAFG